MRARSLGNGETIRAACNDGSGVMLGHVMCGPVRAGDLVFAGIGVRAPVVSGV